MKRLSLLCMTFVLGALLMSGCDKQNDSEPTSGGTNNASLVGTWAVTSQSYFKIQFYTMDGELIDEVESDYDADSKFVFTENKVSTPWMLTYDYEVRDHELVLKYSGLNDRVYEILDLEAGHLVLERISEGESYMMGEEPVTGTEIEHFDLIKKV